MALVAVLWMVLKQAWRNARLEAGLLAGMIIASSVAASIPIYTDGSLQYAFMRAWKEASSDRPPGAFMARFSGRIPEGEVAATYRELTRHFSSVPAQLGMPALSDARSGTADTPFVREVSWQGGSMERRYGRIQFETELPGLVEMVEGRAASADRSDDGVFEAIADVAALDYLDLVVGRVYTLNLDVGWNAERSIRVKLVGAFKPKPDLVRSSHWIHMPPFTDRLFVDEKVFPEVLSAIGDRNSAEFMWSWVLDASRVRIHQLGGLVGSIQAIESTAAHILPGTSWWLSPLPVFKTFLERERALQALLLAVAIPILGMVLYFVVLISGLSVSRRRNEIAMLRSRGASVAQILLGFAVEYGVLGGIAAVTGPPGGYLIAKAMGASSGFLSFVSRTPLPAALSTSAYQAAVYVLLIIVAGALIPAASASRHSIVTYKQEIARAVRLPVWRRFFLDVTLAGIAFLAHRSLISQSRLVFSLARFGEEDVMVDPMLFLAPTLFALAGGLVFLRIFPVVIRAAEALLVRRIWFSPAMTLREISRGTGNYAPLMLLIVLTISLGSYGASMARTVALNLTDQVLYEYGSDVQVKQEWEELRKQSGGGADAASLPGGAASPSATSVSGGNAAPGGTVSRYEAPFNVYRQLPGVVGAARVHTGETAARVGGAYKATGTMMAVDPWDFGGVAWHRKDLLPHHINEYLNLLARYRRGVLVSRGFFDENLLRLGDDIVLTVANQRMDFFVVGAVENWPSLYTDEGPFFVVNLGYLEQEVSIQPYDVWLKLEPDQKLAPIVKGLEERRIWISSTRDSRAELIAGRRDPQRMGMFGMLSAGFVVSVVVSVAGFLLYTFLFLRARLLQFGILRALGLSVRQLFAMLALEQILCVGAAVLYGAWLGTMSSTLFLPFVATSLRLPRAVPPFLVVTDRTDLAKVLLVVGVALAGGLVGLGIAVARMRLHQAVKLGEEA